MFSLLTKDLAEVENAIIRDPMTVNTIAVFVEMRAVSELVVMFENVLVVVTIDVVGSVFVQQV